MKDVNKDKKIKPSGDTGFNRGSATDHFPSQTSNSEGKLQFASEDVRYKNSKSVPYGRLGAQRKSTEENDRCAYSMDESLLNYTSQSTGLRVLKVEKVLSASKINATDRKKLLRAVPNIIIMNSIPNVNGLILGIDASYQELCLIVDIIVKQEWDVSLVDCSDEDMFIYLSGWECIPRVDTDDGMFTITVNMSLSNSTVSAKHFDILRQSNSIDVINDEKGNQKRGGLHKVSRSTDGHNFFIFHPRALNF